MGGQQPVSGATVGLWKAGVTGTYGTGATLLYSTTSDGTGSFNLTNNYSCASGDQLYLTGYGGSSNGGAGNNGSIGLMSLLGECTFVQAQPFFVINEATTVASLAAVQQFATTSYGTSGLTTLAASGVPLNIGAPATNVVGLANAFQAVNNLNPATNAFLSHSFTHTAPVQGTSTTVTVTPPYQKMATLANILASCVNTQDTQGATPGPSTGCNSLFTAAKPAGQASAPADTIQAALDITTTPSSVAGLYMLATASAPFQPALTSAPNDWTLNVTYTSSTVVSPPPATNSALFLYQPSGIAIDASGNVYVSNYLAPTAMNASPYNPSVSEFSTSGVPVGMYFNGTANFTTPQNVIIDPAGNIWSGSKFNSKLTEYVNSTTTNQYNVASNVAQIVSDSAGNIFTSSGGTASIFEIAAGSANGANATVVGAVPNLKTAFMAFDTSLNLWVTNGATSSSSGDQTLNFFPCTAAVGPFCTSTTTNTYASTATKFTNFPALNGTPAVPAGLAIDRNNNVFVALQAYNAASGFGCEIVMTATTVASTTMPTCSANQLGGMNSPNHSQIDGSGNIWIDNFRVPAMQINYPVSGLNYSAGTFSSLSGSTGFTDFVGQPGLIQIDQSGNIWESAFNPVGSNYYISEAIGVASPTAQPTALALKNGTLGRKP